MPWAHPSMATWFRASPRSPTSAGCRGMIEGMRRSAVLFIAAVLLAACSGSPKQDPARDPSSSSADPTSPPIPSPTAPSRTASSLPTRAASDLADWPTYHHDAARTGHVPVGPSGKLTRAWRKDLDGDVYGEPLVVGDTLVVGTEADFVYGLDARSGRTLWRTSLGKPQPLGDLPCGNIDPLGITGTPAYDPRTRQVFVAAETDGGHHTLWALDPRDGTASWHRSLDTQPDRNRKAEQQRAALLVVGGRVLTTFGGLAGDCDNYVGYVASVPTSGRGPTTSYAVPTAREAGMWATPGAVLGPNGSVYVASGNGAELHGDWDHSDSVIELDPATLRERSVFAPSTWREDNVDDLDLGSMAPAVVSTLGRVVIAGKRGAVYLLGPSSHGVGSELASLDGCQAYGGSAVVGRTVLMPCLGQDSIRELRVGPTSMRWGWTRANLFGAPVVAGGRVYLADRDSGDLVVLSLDTGKVVSRRHAGPMPHFPSQVVSGRWVFVPTLDGVTAFRGR